MKPRVAVVASAVASVALIGLAGCGSSGGSKASGTNSLSTPSAASSSGGKVTAKSGSGNFCQNLAKALNDNSAASAKITSGSPNDLKALIDKARSQINTIESTAPSAIRGDVTTELEAAKSFYDSLAAAGYDFKKVDPTKLQSFNEPKVQAASQHVVAYIQKDCGINLGLPSTSP